MLFRSSSLLLALVAGASLITSTAQAATTAPAAASPAPAGKAAPSATMGTVQQVEAYEVEGQGSGVGVVAGAVVGGLLGNRVGKGSGNALATVGGAVAGGYAGNQIEKSSKRHVMYRTSVKFDDGHTAEYHLPKSYATGTRVQLKGKRIYPAS